MTRQLSYEIIADGGTDRALAPILEWAIHQHDPTVEVLEPEFAKRKGSVKDFFMHREPRAQLTFAHRDAEALSHEERLREFLSIDHPNLVPVVPVRMTETWLLVDKEAICAAAGNPSAQITLPELHSLETLSDPKEVLHELLLQASNLNGRRRKSFSERIVERRIDVARRIRAWENLCSLDSFKEMRASLAAAYPYGAQKFN